MKFDYKKIAEKWQKKWKEAKLFEAKPNEKSAFYIQVAYPYPSGAMHIGHARTYCVTDVVARYKRLKGYNVLMPMGWHVSGAPVIAAVEALKRNDEKMIRRMVENFRIPKEDLDKLKTPEGFVDYFVNKAKTGYKHGFNLLGLSIDWRRELTTIDAQYQKFIQWQYRKLYEKGYLRKGKYPVRYCPHDKMPVGDHDLSKGEGVSIQEFVLLKYKLVDEKNTFLVAATLRPETVFGLTNVWVDPNIVYWKVKVKNYANEEIWILSKECFEKLKYQKKNIEKVGEIKGKELVGKKVIAPLIHKQIPVYYSYFCDPSVGTGIVGSVPSDAPDDYMGLEDLKKDVEKAKEFGIDIEELMNIEPIPIIDVPKLGKLAAKQICISLGIKNQHQREKLIQARKIVYKEGFHKGVMLESCSKYARMPVSKAKDLVKEELLQNKEADIIYELEDEVICRCGTKVVVAILEDQWFICYSDREWKNASLETLADMHIVPEFYRTQYENVFEWLEDKPCTRSKGLGTKFPWDETKVIEPLGDSTIYMAYFTISHLIKNINAENLNDEIFDYIFLNKGNLEELSKKYGIKKEMLEEMRKNFDYWYPLAYNVSAIELIPNHMSFSIFHHTAIFPKEKRQKGTLNLGMLIIEGQKMASSKGNVKLVTDMVDAIGADMLRLFLMNVVEPWQEMDWRQREVEKGLKIVNNLLEFVYENAKKFQKEDNKKETSHLEKWLLNQFNFRLKNASQHMESFELRKAIQQLIFQFANDIKWFEKRGGILTKETFMQIFKKWTICISPFMPHIAEELWKEGFNENGFVIQQKWPSYAEIDEKLMQEEEYIKKLVEDLREVQQLAKIKHPKRIILYIAPKWKWDALQRIQNATKEKKDFGKAMKAVMELEQAKEKPAEAKVLVGFIMKHLADFLNKEFLDEFEILKREKEFLEREFCCEVAIENAEAPGFDPAKKAPKAIPLKPAVYME